MNVTLRKDCSKCVSGRLVAKQCYGGCDPSITTARLRVLEGMRMAHVAVWRAIDVSGRDAIVLEDDIAAGPGSTLVDPTRNGMSLQTAVTYLRHRAIHVGFLGSCAHAHCCETAMCTHALYLTPAAAQQLLGTVRSCMPSDLPVTLSCATKLRCRKFVNANGHNRELFVQDKTTFPPTHLAAEARTEGASVAARGREEANALFHQQHLGGEARCRCVLVDVGLNTGSSLVEWPHQAMVKLGKPHGKQHQQQVTPPNAWAERSLLRCAVDRDTCYYGFEANPTFTPQLRAMESQLRNGSGYLLRDASASGGGRYMHRKRVKIFTATAFHLGGDGEVDFFVETAGRHPSLSSTLVGAQSTYWQDTERRRWHINHSLSMADHAQRVRVAAMDAAHFLESLAATSDFVALKLDVEGYEFSLLPQLLREHRNATCAVQLWAIEFHEHLSREYADEAARLQAQLRSCATDPVVLDWH